MIARFFRPSVMGLALAASTLTATAWADAEPAPPAVAPAPLATASGTPLGVRPTKSLELAPESSSSGIGWKLGSVVLIAALGVWAWKRRGPLSGQPLDAPELRILRRTSIGVRSELLVVEMDGQRLLLGVTPSTIQNLYIAPLPDDSAPAEKVLVEPVVTLTPRAEVVRRPEPEKKTVSRRLKVAASGEPVEEQARGIYAASERK